MVTVTSIMPDYMLTTNTISLQLLRLAVAGIYMHILVVVPVQCGTKSLHTVNTPLDCNVSSPVKQN